MSEIRVIRTGSVTYKAGQQQTKDRPGAHPFYETVRAEQYSDGSVYYYPKNAALAGYNTDGACELPERLHDSIVWDD